MTWPPRNCPETNSTPSRKRCAQSRNLRRARSKYDLWIHVKKKQKCTPTVAIVRHIYSANWTLLIFFFLFSKVVNNFLWDQERTPNWNPFETSKDINTWLRKCQTCVGHLSRKYVLNLLTIEKLSSAYWELSTDFTKRISYLTCFFFYYL